MRAALPHQGVTAPGFGNLGPKRGSAKASKKREPATAAADSPKDIQQQDDPLSKEILIWKAIIQAGKAGGMSPNELRHHEDQLVLLEERRTSAKPPGRRMAELQKRKETLAKKIETERKVTEDLEAKLAASKETSANLTAEHASIDAQLALLAASVDFAPVDRIIGGMDSLESSLQNAAGDQLAAQIVEACQPLKTLLQSLKVAASLNSEDPELLNPDNMRVDDDENVVRAKQALDAAILEASKRRKCEVLCDSATPVAGPPNG